MQRFFQEHPVLEQQLSEHYYLEFPELLQRNIHFPCNPGHVWSQSFERCKVLMNATMTSQEGVILVVGMVVAFAVSLVVIKFLMEYIKKHDFKVFGWYRIILGVIVLLCGFAGFIG